ncbi:unnamed protein product [Paramecium sonneborni]|uniref:Uncharacterized protein n=1 Tax=Paramecium sonneborni TaxID=65129 RepID=A0A8S1MJA9_9CILI|nr:unnamed protein product [Paramecium sonneborni]
MISIKQNNNFIIINKRQINQKRRDLICLCMDLIQQDKNQERFIKHKQMEVIQNWNWQTQWIHLVKVQVQVQDQRINHGIRCLNYQEEKRHYLDYHQYQHEVIINLQHYISLMKQIQPKIIRMYLQLQIQLKIELKCLVYCYQFMQQYV